MNWGLIIRIAGTAITTTVALVAGKKVYDEKSKKSYIILVGLMGAGKSKTFDICFGKGYTKDSRQTFNQRQDKLDNGVWLVDTGGSVLDTNREELDKKLKDKKTKSIYFVYVFDAKRYLGNEESCKDDCDRDIKNYKEMLREYSKITSLKLLGTHADEISDKNAIEKLAIDIRRKFGAECEIFALAEAEPNSTKAKEMQEAIKKFIKEDNA